MTHNSDYGNSNHGNPNIDTSETVEARLDRLVAWYGDGADGTAPTRAQWRALLERPSDQAVTVVNFFKLRRRAVYPEDAEATKTSGISGKEAFDRYAAVSGPTLEKVGGRFLLLAPFEAALMGAAEDWDLVVVGTYPDSEALLALHEDADYRSVYPHRSGALERQKVFACSA
ncbi:DUF1330 domain-containing protein [Pelagibius sp.]|uniref:DUF1330 domain-containing protein n=1 Tax=Pelagibius sp. TaxID=1931238 RepID=UPI002638E9E0|nr:DUF1330 domain-containing protein [Pelagibius sp.]